MVYVRELVSGDIFCICDVNIVYVNKDQLKYDTTYNSEDVICKALWDTIKDHEKEWHNNARNTPFIVGDGALYECEFVIGES